MGVMVSAPDGPAPNGGSPMNTDSAVAMAQRLALEVADAMGPSWSWNAVSVDSTGGGCTAAVVRFVCQRRYSGDALPRECALVVVADHSAPMMGTVSEYAADGVELMLGVYDGSDWCAGLYPFDDECGRGFAPLRESPWPSLVVACCDYLRDWSEWVAAGRPQS